MTTLRLYFQDERVGPLLRRATDRAGQKVRSAARETALEAADEIVQRGREDIKSAPGNWGERWPAGLNATVTEGGGNIRIAVTHTIPYYNVFERGALIRGKPLLWIPLSAEYGGSADVLKGAWSEGGGTSIRARDYPGRLFRVDRKGGKAPLLLATEVQGGKKVGVPKYFGKSEVVIPKKFHVTEIAKDVARHMKEIYTRNIR